MTKLFESQAEEITRIILVRHGRTKKNTESRFGARDDSPLDSLGKEQARKVAERMTDFPVAHIFSSPINRTMQTAEFIANKLSLEIESSLDLTEYDFGIISGLTMNEVQEKHPVIYQQLQDWMLKANSSDVKRAQVPGAESFNNLEKRILEFTNSVLNRFPGKTIVAVTHLALIKAFMATLFGESVHRPMNFIAFNTSLTVIDFLRRRPILMAFNDISHLDQKLNYGRITPL